MARRDEREGLKRLARGFATDSCAEKHQGCMKVCRASTGEGTTERDNCISNCNQKRSLCEAGIGV